MKEKENRYEVLNKGWEESKIRLIKRLDDLQGDLDINIRPFDKKLI